MTISTISKTLSAQDNSRALVNIFQTQGVDAAITSVADLGLSEEAKCGIEKTLRIGKILCTTFSRLTKTEAKKLSNELTLFLLSPEEKEIYTKNIETVVEHCLPLILSYLPFTEIMCTASLVNRHFNSMGFYGLCDQLKEKSSVNIEPLFYYQRALEQKKMAAGIQNDKIEVLNYCDQLKKIEFNFTGLVPRFSPDFKEFLQSLYLKLLSRCHISELDFTQFTNCAHEYLAEQCEYMRDIVARCSSLTQLNIQRNPEINQVLPEILNDASCLTTLNLCATAVTDECFPQLPTSLTDLNFSRRLPIMPMGGVPSLPPITDEKLRDLSLRCKRLTILNLETLASISPTGLLHLAQCKMLKTLSLQTGDSTASWLSSNDLLNFLKASPQVSSLKLTCRDWGINDFMTLEQELWRLTCLSIDRSSITATELLNVLEKCPNLTDLSLVGLDHGHECAVAVREKYPKLRMLYST
jgi:hypothetical protein